MPAARTLRVRPLTRSQTLASLLASRLLAGVGRAGGLYGRLADVLQPDRDDVRGATLVEVDPIERRGVRHRHVVVCDHQELALCAKTHEHLAEPPDIGVVE